MPMQHEFTSATPSNATVGNTSTKVVSATSGRTFLQLSNDSDEDFYIAFGRAAVMNKGTLLSPGFVLTIDGDNLFKGDVYAICSSGGKNMAINEA